MVAFPTRIEEIYDTVFHIRYTPARILKLHLLKIAIAKEYKDVF